MRLLVVEDEARIASFVAKGLRGQGFDVDWVETGSDALAAAESGVDLVLLDLGLPDLDGLEVLRQLRLRGDTTPVVILSARNDPSDRALGVELGADDYLTKPFSFGDLLARVRARLPLPGAS